MKLLTVVCVLIVFTIIVNAQQNIKSINQTNSKRAINSSQNYSMIESNSNTSLRIAPTNSNKQNESNTGSLTTPNHDEISVKKSDSDLSTDKKQTNETPFLQSLLWIVTSLALLFGFFTQYRAMKKDARLVSLTEEVKELTVRQVNSSEQMTALVKTHNQAIKDLTQKQIDLAEENTVLAKGNQQIIENQDKSRFYEEFKDFHAEFWMNPTMAQVRKWIANDEAYKEIKPILVRRQKGQVSNKQYDTLEKIDQFFALLTRLARIRFIEMDENQKKLWNEVYNEYWLAKCFERKELEEYINSHWVRLAEIARTLKRNGA